MLPNPIHMVGGGIEVSRTSISAELVQSCLLAFQVEQTEYSFDVNTHAGNPEKRTRYTKELGRDQQERFGALYQLLDEFVLQSLYKRGEGYTGSVSRQQLMLYDEGVGSALHVDDQFKPPESYGPTKYVMHLLNQFAGLLYISTDDLEGGELVFPTHDVSVTPVTGTLVAFPSNHLFPHMVNLVTKGKRIAIARHYYVKDTPAV
jgi:predicted 2-oxoglutarate/Fe(II)-dependent dioxygenase YbiX